MIAEPIAGSPAQTTSQQPRIMIAALVVTLLFGHWYDVGPATAAAADDWRTVQSYRQEESAWRQNDKQGAHPEITRAVAAAKAIIATPDHPKTADAAMFLMAYPPGVSPTAEADVSVGEHALAAHVGPDWSVVEGWDAAMMQNMPEIVSADISDYEKMRQVDALSYRPIAAALAVLNAEGHPKAREAAEFLVNQFRIGRCLTRYVILGAETLRARFPEYDNWMSMLFLMDSCGQASSDAAALVNRFYETMATNGADPGVRGIARYFLAAGLKRSVNSPTISREDREARRRSALKWATGLSAGAEGAEIRLRYGPDNRPGRATLAQAEEQLIDSIRRTTVGSQVAEVVGRRLDGVEEKLSDYRGKTVLVDFWATWCGPCIAGLPELRRLNADLPAERFSLLSISVDEHLEVVTEFHKREAMPWPNWHVGNASDVARIMDVIRARRGSLSDTFVSAIKNTVSQP